MKRIFGCLAFRDSEGHALCEPQESLDTTVPIIAPKGGVWGLRDDVPNTKNALVIH